MAIIRWRPFSDLDKFFDNINNFTKEIDQDLSTDIYEQGSNIVIEMNVAGIKPENIDITIENDYVKVSGSRQEEHEEHKNNNKQYFKKELKRGIFERVIDLPTSIEVDKVKADIKHGMLIITLPKSNKKESRRIKPS